ncbi:MULTISPECIES: hypothetical protein [Bacillus]|uniref:hypothetical protein n=1 Tax=Bacillus TaxID=1386 RepID=UPI0029C2E254|nr:hypothetical protein [Bacillus cereus group sp. BfR-BA-00999]MDX5885023.1 hypothetical protein [Bacillus cereus group sp. BfR-BA-00999]
MTEELAINAIGRAKMNGRTLLGDGIDYVNFRDIVESNIKLNKIWYEYLSAEVEGEGDNEKWYLTYNENKWN